VDNGPAFVRADIAFLRQDLSVTLAGQRFDFLVQSRYANTAEKAALVKQEGKRDYPQRQAVLFALRELTGQDAGLETSAWQERFPRAEEEARAVRLARKIVEANPLQQPLLLDHHRDTPGAVHTLTLARAVAGLQGPSRERAEAALVERLVRRSAWTRWNALREDEPALCQAAIRACVRLGERQRVIDLVALLESADAQTVAAANEGLRELTGQDLDGPAAWLAWWQNAGKVAALP
jgi:hypothetical protein